MASQLFLVLITAAVTSATILGAAWLLYERWLKQRILEAIDAKAAQLISVMEARVREGVRQGIRDGVAGPPSDVIRTTSRGLTETGATVIGDSIGTLFGRPGRRRDE